MSNITVENDVANQRFVVRQDGQVAVLVYQLTTGRIAFLHTSVPAALEGRGLGGALARHGLEHARTHNLAVLPYCPFVRGYIERHPEYQALVSTTFRSQP